MSVSMLTCSQGYIFFTDVPFFPRWPFFNVLFLPPFKILIVTAWPPKAQNPSAFEVQDHHLGILSGKICTRNGDFCLKSINCERRRRERKKFDFVLRKIVIYRAIEKLKYKIGIGIYFLCVLFLPCFEFFM